MIDRIGAIAGLTVLALMPAQMIVYVLWPPPQTVVGWFELLRGNAIVGLLDLDLLLTLDYLLLGAVFVALWSALKATHESMMTLALMLEGIAIASYLASTVAFEMLALSDRYSAAASDGERAIILAAGHALMATWQGTAFSVSYVIAALALVITSWVMRQSAVFTPRTAYTGLIAGTLNLVPPTIGSIGVALSLISLLPTAIWLALVARELLSRGWPRGGVAA